MPATSSLDTDPGDRQIDRILACMGLLDDAVPLFRPGSQVPGAGVLLAIPMLVDSGVFEIAREIYGSIGPAFYGLRTTFVTLLMMALLRIKRAEGLKEHSPRSLGRLLGLDWSPEVKTLRRKLTRLAAYGRAAEFGHALAEHRVKTRGHALGFLYVDGHVRAYHGKRSLPKTHLARMRLSMPATTDYWVNDAEGDPLFVVTTEANKGLVAMLPVVLDEVRSLVGDHQVTVVFDRGGWSQKLFAKLITSGFDILTYRKGRCRRVPKKHFSMHKATLDERKIKYQLADQNVYLFYGSRPHRKRLQLRQVIRLGDDGHQTQIITSRKDLSTIEVAYRMFDRWRQENFFKYLREEYALDALVDYGVEPADATRDVPNPQRKKLNAQLHKELAELNLLVAEYGAEAFVNPESVRRTMRGFKIANAPRGRDILDAMKRVTELKSKRASVPTRVPVQQVTEGEVTKLSVERKHITDLLKMVAPGVRIVVAWICRQEVGVFPLERKVVVVGKGVGLGGEGSGGRRPKTCWKPVESRWMSVRTNLWAEKGMEMPYSETFKRRIVQKMSVPDAQSARALAEEEGLCQSTLSRWFRNAGKLGDMKKTPSRRETSS